MNIISIFILNLVKQCVPRDPPWINKPLKTLLKMKKRFYKNDKRHGYKNADRERLEAFRTECNGVIEAAKLLCLNNLGRRLNDPGTTPETTGKIIHRVMDKSRAPKILPHLDMGNFVRQDKPKLFKGEVHIKYK